MTQPQISIVVPVYNLEKYLESTVGMLTEQTYRNLEIILVDDGSTDASPAICDRLAAQDARILVIHTENRGVSAARNTGLRKASGEYIGFCDGDDQLDRDMYEYLYRLISDADADISICGVCTCYADGSRKMRQMGCDAVFQSPQEAICSLLHMKTSRSIYAKLFRADVISGLYMPEDIRVREDEYYSYMAFCRAKRIVCGAQAKYTYIRRDGSSSMAAFSEKFFDMLTVCDRLENEVGALFPELKPWFTAKKLKELIHIYKLMILRNAGPQYKAAEASICKCIQGQDWSSIMNYLSANDRIRYRMMKISKYLYRLVVKAYDRF